MDTAAGAARRLRAAIIAATPATDAATLTAIAASIGRSSIHCSSPSTALVAHARSCAGLPNTIGFTAIQTPTSGALAHLVHALHGLQCRANTARFTCRHPAMSSTLNTNVSTVHILTLPSP